jgi:hypothetical protein
VDRAGRRQGRASRRRPRNSGDRLHARDVSNDETDLDTLLEHTATYGTPGLVINQPARSHVGQAAIGSDRRGEVDQALRLHRDQLPVNEPLGDVGAMALTWASER